ncbi:MAG: hypothetical protein WAU00_05310 [Caldilinea sp.]|uniref:hypothetical protein n=1 Tax=Caldilinea sp. TaxID=2293560 RepID=UPI002C9D94A1|nr:hypothetical protein [Anaerolineales bacterium]HQY94808.1 hypothetical protein [Caldilinea sp.]HRA65001.1 hypothetical protein [Caldilinea sp.]
MIAETRPLVEITQDALDLLYRELGVVATTRFLNQFTAGFGNYTDERRALLADQSLEEALTAVRAYQARRPPHEHDCEPSSR